MSLKKWIATVLVLALPLVFGQTLCADQPVEDVAAAAAEAWLALVDEGKYSESWNEAALLFKGAITREQWEATLQAFRSPLGNVISREPLSKQYTKTLPGAPDGEYVVIQYKTSFENKEMAIETITPMLDKDGIWRVSGYYFK